MTEHLRRDLERIKRPDTELQVVNPEHGPVSVESVYDETLAAAQILPLVRKASEEGYDAIIVACFSDPGLDAAKEVSDALVLGIEETSMHVAAMLGHKFAVTTAFARRVPVRELHARLRSVESAYGSCLTMNMSVLDMHAKPAEAKARILELARRAVQEEGVEVIILGCAGLSGYAEDLERDLGVTVVDPSAVTLKVAESLAELHVRHSKLARFAKLPAKEIK
jgi:allantoin racemase